MSNLEKIDKFFEKVDELFPEDDSYVNQYSDEEAMYIEYEDDDEIPGMLELLAEMGRTVVEKARYIKELETIVKNLQPKMDEKQAEIEEMVKQFKEEFKDAVRTQASPGLLKLMDDEEIWEDF